jgi:hypothetical protein
MKSSTFSRLAAFAIIAGICILPALASEKVPASFNDFKGSWTGNGVLSLTGGAIESLKCKAYYTPQNKGQGLGIAIRCASPSSALELRAALTSSGDKINGSWEERTYNASGNVSGGFAEKQIDLAIKGGAFNGSMRVTMDGSNQKVAIETEGIALKGIKLSLTRLKDTSGT